MNKGALIVVIVAVLLLGGGFLLFKNSSTPAPTPSPEDTTQSAPSPADTVQNESTGAGANSDTTEAVKEVTVSGSPYKFEPSTISVKKGDTVKLTFKNTAGTHDFVIDELNVKTKTIAAGESETVTFTADKAGSFEYYCAVANHKAMGMKGTLVVD